MPDEKSLFCVGNLYSYEAICDEAIRLEGNDSEVYEREKEDVGLYVVIADILPNLYIFVVEDKSHKNPFQWVYRCVYIGRFCPKG